MASQLLGLIRQLIWNDFKGKPSAADLAKMQQIAANASSGTVGMAMTASDFTVSYGGSRPGEPVLTADPGGSTYSLADTITITVVFDPMKSWAQTGPLTTSGSQFLLDHEQGHYDLTALMARDCFIDLMQLKAKSYAAAADGQKEAKDIFQKYHDKLNPVQDKYDWETTHGAWVTPSMGPERKASDQVRWEGFVQTAFTSDRPSGGSSPSDGKSYKVRILDVLAKGGFVF